MIWVIAVMATEAITEILLESALLDKPRAYLTKRWFFKELLGCGWCLSVWVAAAVVGVIAVGLKIILIPFVVHRIANVLHDLYGLLKKLRWRDYAIRHQEKE